MPNLYSFRRLINKYSVPFLLELETNAGSYEYGDWTPERTPPVEHRGAIVPMPQRAVYESGGRLTDADRVLYVDQSLAIPPKSRVHYRGQTYHVEQYTPYEEYGDFNRYTLKHISAFNEEAGAYS